MKRSGAVRAVVQVLAFASGVGAACGRTDIDPANPCSSADTTRPCSDVCGEGTQFCLNGAWQACVVPPTSRACTGTCGEGTQQCVNRTWLACLVPVTTRACPGPCAPGKQTCT